MTQDAKPVSLPTLVPPSDEFVRQANVSGMDAYRAMYARSVDSTEEFWGQLAEQELDWFQRFEKPLDWNPPFAKWFVGGKLNVCYNCVDRHAMGGRGNKAAIIFEGEPGDQRTITYRELQRLVTRFASSLLELGMKTGDRAVIYMPMIPEAAIAMLGCARLGIPHSVVFGGFSAEALKARIQDLDASVVITTDEQAAIPARSSTSWLAASPTTLRAGSRSRVASLSMTRQSSPSARSASATARPTRPLPMMSVSPAAAPATTWSSS